MKCELLTKKDYIEAAKNIDCEVAVIQAIAEVESSGCGFINDKTKIRFEVHKFWAFWGRDNKAIFKRNFKFNKLLRWRGHKYLSSDRWLYVHSNQITERDAIAIAFKYSDRATKLATSYGKFQIMGFNYELAGYETLDKYVSSMHISERNHLKAFISFCISTKAAKYLRNKRFYSFARIYNGKKNAFGYSKRMKKAYKKYNDN
jgi:hypothetical protein